MTRISCEVAKAAVMNNEGEVLVLVRSDDDDHRAGGYDLPGGELNDDERHSTEGAIRELTEETGMRFPEQALFLAWASTKYKPESREGGPISIIWLGYVAFVEGRPNVVLDPDEHQRYEWMELGVAAEISRGLTQGDFLDYLLEHDIPAHMQDAA